MKHVIECYGVVDDGELLYESIDDKPMAALRSAEWNDEDGNEVHRRMIAGRIKVHSLRIEIMGEAELPEPMNRKAGGAKA